SSARTLLPEPSGRQPMPAVSSSKTIAAACSSVPGDMTQSIEPPTRKLVSSAKRLPRSAVIPRRLAISSRASSRFCNSSFTATSSLRLCVLCVSALGRNYETAETQRTQRRRDLTCLPLRLFFQQPNQLITNSIHRSRSQSHNQITGLHVVAQ